jgi:AmmeMemoRadiSam system protein B
MEGSRVRRPAFAGQFYPGTAQELKRNIDSLVVKNAKKQDIIACMLPHAGYMYSGKVAAETISRINLKDRIILLGPNHTGYGSPFSIMTDGTWQTPLGDVKIDKELAKKILAASKFLENDALAHMYEHSLEVELPFLQYFKSDFQIVPIAFLTDDINGLKEVGKEIAIAIKGSGAMMVASSDMTHYESQQEASRKDSEAIKAVLELNEDKLMERIRGQGISMCGYAPAIAMISAAKALGAKNAELVKYQTSGDVTGDMDSVVGYAGIIIY